MTLLGGGHGIQTLVPSPQERLINSAFAVCDVQRHLPRNVVGIHVSRQLVRVHKLQVSLKELRESWDWLWLAQRACPRAGVDDRVGECDELIAIVVKRVTTAKARRR